MTDIKLETATFGAGCFWCVEAVFQRVNGVEKVEPGYAGGDVKNPTYNAVCSGTTGHAEVLQLEFDPSVVSYETLLEVLWHTHNPTTLNQQGADKGTQYRSAIFYHSEAQKMAAEKSIAATDASDLWDDPIVTEITPINNYSTAEDYHHNYYNEHSSQGYCSITIAPKLQKLYAKFGDFVKP